MLAMRKAGIECDVRSCSGKLSPETKRQDRTRKMEHGHGIGKGFTDSSSHALGSRVESAGVPQSFRQRARIEGSRGKAAKLVASVVVLRTP